MLGEGHFIESAPQLFFTGEIEIEVILEVFNCQK
jgi:hypothetical protein